MKQIIASSKTYVVLRIAGFGLLGGYLWLAGDWRISLTWALLFPVLAFLVAWVLIALKLSERFPVLNDYLLYPRSSRTSENAISDNEWAMKQARYLEQGLRGWKILAAPAEEGLICVPVLLFGITPISALLGGVAFGLLHLARYSYLECIGKAIIYSLACYFLLPLGVITVAFGHLLLDALALAMLVVARHRIPS